jgi:hypothetical protein
MYPIEEEKILEAILTEAKASGLSLTFVALIERIYHNQQKLSQGLSSVQSTLTWERQRTEKWMRELEEKVDPEKAAKRKIADEMPSEKVTQASNSFTLGTL